MPDPMTLFQKFFGVRNIMDRMLGNFQTGDYLPISINRDGCFQEPFSGFPGSPGIIMTGIRTGESGGIDGSAGDLFAPIIEHSHEPVEQSIERR